MLAFHVKECFNVGMDKQKAIDLLGGSPSAAARAIGITPQAINAWPEVLSPRIADRVIAAQARLKPPKVNKHALTAESRSKKQAPQVSPVSVS